MKTVWEVEVLFDVLLIMTLDGSKIDAGTY